MQIEGTDRHHVQKHASRFTLIITDVHASDFGNYSCSAENTMGKTRKSLELTGKPNVAVVRSSNTSHFKDKYVHEIVIFNQYPNIALLSTLKQIQCVLGGLFTFADRRVQTLLSQSARESNWTESSGASRRSSQSRSAEDVRQSRLRHRPLAVPLRLARSGAAGSAAIARARTVDVVFDKKLGAEHTVRGGDNVEVTLMQ